MIIGGLGLGQVQVMLRPSYASGDGQLEISRYVEIPLLMLLEYQCTYAKRRVVTTNVCSEICY